jgi:hypothetical protein
MVPSDFLLMVVDRLDALGIRYFVTGSMASAFYAEPRLTNDVDIVIEFEAGGVAAFVAEFPDSDYYLSEDAIRSALRSHGQFNVIHPASALKVDFMVVADTPFNRSRFSRVREFELPGGRRVRVAAPEDVILKKLEYYREGGSEKHLRDIASMLKVESTPIEMKYIERWVTELAVVAEWNAVKARLGR